MISQKLYQKESDENKLAMKFNKEMKNSSMKNPSLLLL